MTIGEKILAYRASRDAEAAAMAARVANERAAARDVQSFGLVVDRDSLVVWATPDGEQLIPTQGVGLEAVAPDPNPAPAAVPA